jgi:hypothetical protein
VLRPNLTVAVEQRLVSIDARMNSLLATRHALTRLTNGYVRMTYSLLPDVSIADTFFGSGPDSLIPGGLRG